jgi:hypothetical protein
VPDPVVAGFGEVSATTTEGEAESNHQDRSMWDTVRTSVTSVHCAVRAELDLDAVAVAVGRARGAASSCPTRWGRRGR